MWAPEPVNYEAERVLQELSHDLMSPYCPGRTIASCPSKNARKLEERILEEAKGGKTREEIEQTLVADFGSDIIGYRPPPSLMIATVGGGVVALALLMVAGRRWVRGRPGGAVMPAASPAKGGPSIAERDALEDALDDVDGF